MTTADALVANRARFPMASNLAFVIGGGHEVIGNGVLGTTDVADKFSSPPFIASRPSGVSTQSSKVKGSPLIACHFLKAYR
jgi:hypothetical protein